MPQSTVSSISSSAASNTPTSTPSIALETTSGSAMKPEQVLYGSPYVKAVLLNLWDFSSGPRTEQIWVGQSLKPADKPTREEIQTQERPAKGRDDEEVHRSSQVRSSSSSALSSRSSTFNANGDPMTTMLHGTVSLEALDHAHLSTSPPPPPVLSNIAPSMKVTKLLSRSGGTAGGDDAKEKRGWAPSLSDTVVDPVASTTVQLNSNRDTIGSGRLSSEMESNAHQALVDARAASPPSYDDDDSSDSLSHMIDENYVAKQRPAPKKGEINKKLRGRPLVASSHPKHSKTNQTTSSNSDYQGSTEGNALQKNTHVYLSGEDHGLVQPDGHVLQPGDLTEEVLVTAVTDQASEVSRDEDGRIDQSSRDTLDSTLSESSMASVVLDSSKASSHALKSSSQEVPSHPEEGTPIASVESSSTTSDLGNSESSFEDAWSDDEEETSDAGDGDAPHDLGDNLRSSVDNSDDNDDYDESSDDEYEDDDDGWNAENGNPSTRN